MGSIQTHSRIVFSPSIDPGDLINFALEAEYRSEFNELKNILKPIWSNLANEIDLTNVDEKQQAVLLKIAGSMMLKFGKTKQLFNYIARGKDYLSKSARLFEDQKNRKDLAQTEVLLAWSYCLEEDFSSFKIYLDEAEEKYGKDTDSDIYLFIQFHRFVYYSKVNEPQPALDLFDKIFDLLKKCADDKLISQIHNEIGLVHKKLAHYEKATIHYRNSIAAAMKAENDQILGITLNNLAGVYLHTDDLDLALISQNEAVKLYENREDFGMLAYAYDTRAAIYYRRREYRDALKNIGFSISLFEKGILSKDYLEALYLKTKILICLNYRLRAAATFKKLIKTTKTTEGDIKAKFFERELKKEFNGEIDEIFAASPSPIISQYVINHPFGFNYQFRGNTNNLYCLKISADFTQKFFFQEGETSIICLEKNARIGESDLRLFKLDKDFVVGEMRRKDGSWIAESTETQKAFNHHQAKPIGKIVGICSLEAIQRDKYIFREA